MAGKAEYRSSLRSKKLIREAFFELMTEKEKSRITVTDIVTRADINRRTFYAHYQDVRALIELLEDETIEKIEEFITDGKKADFPIDPLPLVSKMAEYIEENLDYFRILISGDNSDPFIRKLKKMLIRNAQSEKVIPQSVKSTLEFKILTNFMVGGLINVIQMWVSDDMGHSLSEYSQALAGLMSIPKPNKAIIDETFRHLSPQARE
jgi:AcrR family transcriptional regulator